MKRILLAAATAALLMPAVQAQTEVRLAVHKSFSLPKDAFAAFERANDAKVSVIKAGSGNELVNKLVLSRAQPIADAVYGLDNTTVVCVSHDLPFALGRFCGAEGINNVVVGSAFRSS
mgnify:CR=1 FL=1